MVVWWCLCGCVCVMAFLWWCFGGGGGGGGGGVFVVVLSNIAQSSTEVMDVVKDWHQTSPKVLLK